VLAALGTVLLPAAAAPVDPDYTLGPPTWAYLLITVGLIGLSWETLRSPRRIQPQRYALVVALPIGLGAGFIALMLHVATPADQALRVGVPALGLGVVLVAACSAGGRLTGQRLALRVTAVGCAVTAAGQLDWPGCTPAVATGFWPWPALAPAAGRCSTQSASPGPGSRRLDRERALLLEAEGERRLEVVP